MFFEESALVPAAELSSETSRCLAAAAAGGRLVVVADDQPCAALVSLDDLRRLDELDRGLYAKKDDQGEQEIDATAVEYGSLLAGLGPELSPVGIYADGTVAALTVRSHHSIVGREHSGREDFLTAAILGAVLSNSSAVLNFVLAAGRSATGLPPRMSELAHVVEEQANLTDPIVLARFVEQLRGEVERRRLILREHHVRSLDELSSTATQSDDSNKLITELVVVVNDAEELLSGFGGLADQGLRELVRELVLAEDSLGIYLWLSSSRALEMPPVSSITSRVALQMLSPQESRGFLGVAGAETITDSGIGYIKPGSSDEARRFASVLPPDVENVLIENAYEVDHELLVAEPDGRPRRWAGALPVSLAVNQLISQWQADGGMPDSARVPIGLLDRPSEHLHRILELDFAEGSGVVIVGGANTEHVTAAVATIIAIAQDTNASDKLQFIYLGPGGQIAAVPEFLLTDNVLPISWESTERVNETITQILHRVANGAPDAGRLVLVIDGLTGWLSVRDDGRKELVDIARRGAAAGVHLIITASDLHRVPELQQLVGETIELHMGDQLMSQLDRKAAKLMPDDPRRALTKHGQLLLASS